MNNRKYRLVLQGIKLATQVASLIELLLNMASNYRLSYARQVVHSL